MKTELILKSDLLDIIFENRNKEYGAYNLRKFYDSRLMKSLTAMLGIVILLSAFTFLPGKKNKAEKLEYITTSGNIHQANKEPEVKDKKEIKKTTTNTKPANTRIWVSNIKITPDTANVDMLDEITDNVKISNVTNKIPENGDPGLLLPAGGEGGDGSKPETITTIPEIDKNIPLNTAEIMPSFPGGMDALIKFLKRNLSNPRDLEEGETVSVKMRFVVGYDGKLKSFETVEDGGEEFNKEVIRVLKKMPDWIPGKSHGQNVSVYYTIPVKFIVDN